MPPAGSLYLLRGQVIGFCSRRRLFPVDEKQSKLFSLLLSRGDIETSDPPPWIEVLLGPTATLGGQCGAIECFSIALNNAEMISC